VKASVFLSPSLHRAAKIAAMDAGKCLSEFIADLVAAKMEKSK
jgi:predicted HicB family RNase H-like nuclease